jgi:hypothetical protein
MKQASVSSTDRAAGKRRGLKMAAGSAYSTMMLS